MPENRRNNLVSVPGDWGQLSVGNGAAPQQPAEPAALSVWVPSGARCRRRLTETGASFLRPHSRSEHRPQCQHLFPWPCLPSKVMALSLLCILRQKPLMLCTSHSRLRGMVQPVSAEGLCVEHCECIYLRVLHCTVNLLNVSSLGVKSMEILILVQ